MRHLPLIFATLTGLGIACLLGESATGLIILMLVGALGGVLSWSVPKGGERYYWGFIAATFVIVALGVMGVAMHRLVIMSPLVLILAYFMARLAGRLSGQRDELPS